MKIVIGLLMISVISFAQGQMIWEQMADFGGEGRHHAIAFSRGSNGYLLSGTTTVLKKDFWEYNSLTNTWVQLPDYPGPARSYGIGCVIANKAYIGFGHSSNGYPTDWWEYDFTTQQWVQKTNFPGPGRDHPTASVLNGKLYVGFGDDDAVNYKDWWEYNPQTDSWSQKTEYPGLRMHHPMSTSSLDLIYLLGGHVVDFQNQSNYSSKKLYAYNSLTDSWTTLQDITGSGKVAGAMFYADNKIYAGIGIQEPVETFMNDFYEYDITTNTWNSIPNYPGQGLFAAVTFIINNQGYVMTGASETTLENECYRLRPSTSSVTELQQLSVVQYFSEKQSVVITSKQMGEEITIVDLSGKIILSKTKLAEIEALNVSAFQAGMYLVMIGDKATRFVKQ